MRLGKNGIGGGVGNGIGIWNRIGMAADPARAAVVPCLFTAVASTSMRIATWTGNRNGNQIGIEIGIEIEVRAMTEAGPVNAMPATRSSQSAAGRDLVAVPVPARRRADAASTLAGRALGLGAGDHAARNSLGNRWTAVPM